ncbi:MAG: PIN domain-containing protein [Spirochaetaceae bacterium]|nr:MAG: PIN domain-containing protein [Spirochaetaceae bacterium]
MARSLKARTETNGPPRKTGEGCFFVRPAEQVSRWITDHRPLATSAICWYEFLTGPVEEEAIALVTALLAGRILPFTEANSREAARLYNATGRGRAMRIDAMVAAAAIATQAELATENTDDFAPFVPLGLRLVHG